MGKWLYTNLYMIFSQLGTYAFPNGKPQIDWGGGNPPVIPPCTVSKTIGTGLSSTGGDSDVAFGDPLEVNIAITNNLYVVDDDSVQVTMGGTPLAGAWNANTMKVTIAAVTGNVVINVPSLTYVQDGLVAMFDGKNRGSDAGEWVDYKDNTRKIILEQCNEMADHVEFDGQNSTALAANTDVGINVESANGTVEAVASGIAAGNGNTRSYNAILGNHRYAPNGQFKRLIVLIVSYSQYFGTSGGECGATFYQLDSASGESSSNLPYPWLLGKKSISSNDVLHLSLSGARAYLNGSSLNRANEKDYFNVRESAKLGVLTYINSSGEAQKRAGKIYCIRVYDRQLSEQEILQNYNIDRKRFKLS